MPICLVVTNCVLDDQNDGSKAREIKRNRRKQVGEKDEVIDEVDITGVCSTEVG